MNREEILALMRLHMDALRVWLEPGNSGIRRIIFTGSGSAGFGSLTRINELANMLPEDRPNPNDDGE